MHEAPRNILHKTQEKKSEKKKGLSGATQPTHTRKTTGGTERSDFDPAANGLLGEPVGNPARPAENALLEQINSGE